MEKNYKSLSTYIEILVDSFNYEDFQPSIDKANLKKRLVEILGVETPYWKLTTLPCQPPYPGHIPRKHYADNVYS